MFSTKLILFAIRRALLALLALVGIARRPCKVHLGNLIVGVVPASIAAFPPESPPPLPYESFITIGLLVMMFAIVPGAAQVHPVPWQECYERHATAGRE